MHRRIINTVTTIALATMACLAVGLAAENRLSWNRQSWRIPVAIEASKSVKTHNGEPKCGPSVYGFFPRDCNSSTENSEIFRGNCSHLSRGKQGTLWIASPTPV